MTKSKTQKLALSYNTDASQLTETQLLNHGVKQRTKVRSFNSDYCETDYILGQKSSINFLRGL